jgi:hypothetical protein
MIDAAAPQLGGFPRFRNHYPGAAPGGFPPALLVEASAAQMNSKDVSMNNSQSLNAEPQGSPCIIKKRVILTMGSKGASGKPA